LLISYGTVRVRSAPSGGLSRTPLRRNEVAAYQPLILKVPPGM